MKIPFPTRAVLNLLPMKGRQGVGQLLSLRKRQFDMQPIIEKGHIIGLKSADGVGDAGAGRPAGTLSGAPLVNLRNAETGAHLRQMREVTSPLDICMLGVGFPAHKGRGHISWMPKGRYKIMREYAKRGSMGLDMMLRSCTVQVNLDYADERDGTQIQNLSCASANCHCLVWNSPFKGGVPSGLKSTRAQAWTDTDPDRCVVTTVV